MECIFCKIINKELDSYILYEDDIIIVILDKFPDVDGHTLIIPKKHYVDYKELPDDILLHINKYSKIIGDMLLEKLDKNALTILTNYKDAQVIKHYHMHLIPNFKDTPKYTAEEIYKKIVGN